MQVLVEATAADVAARAAEIVRECLAGGEAVTIGLATGQTMVPLYAALGRLHRDARVSFGAATIFALDEYRGVSPTHPASCRAFLERHLFLAVDVAPSRVHLLDGVAPDAAAECARYERAIADAGGLDLQVLGLGRNGHIGFNEPGSPMDSRTRLAPLSETTRQANAAAWGGHPAAVPAEALTMGIGTILEARTCLLLAFGPAKADAVAGAVEGPVTPSLPASALQAHRDARVVLDRAAAARLGGAPRHTPS